MENTFQRMSTKYEYILNNKNESFENKIASLIEVWKSIAELDLPEFDLRHVIQIMDWAKLHTLNIVLTAEWNKFKEKYQDRLLQEIEKAQNELLKLNSAFATHCKKLADVVRNPWEDTTLMKLMKEKDAEIGSEEIEFFCVETAYLVSVRLKKLCESQCEDLALNLVTAFMNCNKLSKSQNFNMNATETQMWFIFDIYIALLYKFQEKQKMVALLKELSFDEGLQLVKRFAKKRVKISKIWKNCQRIAVFATQMYISQAVLKYSSDLQSTLEQYIELYISLCNADNLQDFSDSIRRISNLADAAGLYVFCDVIQRKAGQKLKPFTIEMYIRALTTDMNELERQKDAKDTDKVQVITQRLANAFVSLAYFLDEHVNVARECVLTAFSLAPTSDRLRKIEELAQRSGFQVVSSELEWKCKLHPPALPTDEITWICPECGDWMCKPSLDLPKINMALHEALQNSVLGISEALCDDLVVCLSNPRYQILSWFLPWNDLHRLCRMYLQDPQNTKNIVTELKFVDIDYSIFKDIKREPLDELAGIERGYEQYLDQNFVSDEESISNSEDSMSQDSRPYSLGSDGAGDSLFLPLLPTAPQKSDPNTLKSLRMFRPNLKRLKEKDPGESTPEKVFKPSTIVRESQASKSDQNLSSGSSEGLPSTTTASNDDSKNVKTATLPQLGGQVARTEIKATQERQELSLKDLLSASVNLAHREPQKLSKEMSFTKSAEQTLTQKIQNKPLLIGSNENSKLTPNKEMEASHQHPKEESYLRQKPKQKGHPLRSVLLSSKVGSSIHSSEQRSNVDNQDIPPLVVKTPLISYPPHPRHRKAVLAVQEKLQVTTPCISSNIQQAKAIEEPRPPILAPPSTQQEINSRLSATQSMISLQQKSQLVSQQAVTPLHTQTSENSASLLENQLRAPVAANSQKETNIHLRQESQLPIERHTQTTVNTKPTSLKGTAHSSPKTSQVECERQVATPLPNSHPQIIVERSQLGSHGHPSLVRPQEVRSLQAGPNSSHQQNLLSDNIAAGVACPQPTLQKESQLTTLPKNQREVSSTGVASTSQEILQATPQLDSLHQSTSLKLQEINMSKTKTAVMQSLPNFEVTAQLLMTPEEAVQLKERFIASLKRLADLEHQRANLADLMTNHRQQIGASQESTLDPTPPESSPLNSSSQTAAASPPILLDSQYQLKFPKSQETNLSLTKMTPPMHLQTAVKAASPSQETRTCQNEMKRAPQQKYLLDSQRQVITEVVSPSPPSLQEKCQMLSRNQSTTLTSQDTNHSQPASRVTCQQEPQTTVEPSSQHPSTVHKSHRNNSVQEEVDHLSQQVVRTTSQRQTTVVDSPSPRAWETKCPLEKQCQSPALTYQGVNPSQTEMNLTPQQKLLVDSHLQPVVKIVKLVLPTLPEYCHLGSQSAAVISQETNPQETSTFQEEPSLDKHLPKMLKPSQKTPQPDSQCQQTPPKTQEMECSSAEPYLSHQPELPLDRHLQTTEISCSQPNLQEIHQSQQDSQFDSYPQPTTKVSCSQSILLGDSRLNIQHPPTQEPSLLPSKMKPKGDQCLPQLRVVISPKSQLSTEQLLQGGQCQSPVTESPKYKESAHQTQDPSRFPQLRVVISPNTQLPVHQRQRKRRGHLPPVTKSKKRPIVKKKTKRHGQKSPSNIRPKKRGRPRKNPPSSPRIDPLSTLPTTNLPTTSQQGPIPQPKDTYKVCLLVREAPPQKPLVIPEELKKYLSQLEKPKPPAPQPSTSQQLSCTTTVSPKRMKSSLSLIASIRKEEWPLIPQWPCSDNRDMFDASRILQDFFSRKRTPSPEPPPPPIHTHSTRSPSCLVQIHQEEVDHLPQQVSPNLQEIPQSPITQELSLPQLRVVISPKSQLSTKQLLQGGLSPDTESPEYKESVHQTQEPSRFPKLRVVISPNSQLTGHQCQRKCRGHLSPVPKSKKKTKRLGQQSPSNNLPKKRGRPRKNPPSSHRINPPSFHRPTTAHQGPIPQPKNTYEVSLLVREVSAPGSHGQPSFVRSQEVKSPQAGPSSGVSFVSHSQTARVASTSQQTLQEMAQLNNFCQSTSPQPQETNLPRTKPAVIQPMPYLDVKTILSMTPEQAVLLKDPLVAGLRRLAYLEHQRANLVDLMANRLQQIGQRQDSSLDLTPPQWSPLSNSSRTANPKSKETNLSPTKINAATPSQETGICQKEMMNDSQLNIQPPLTQEPSLLPSKMKPKGDQCLPQLRVVISPKSQLSTKQLIQGGQCLSPVKESPKYKESTSQTLRVVISRHTEPPVHPLQINRPSSSPRINSPSILPPTNIPTPSHQGCLLVRETPAHEKPLIIPMELQKYVSQPEKPKPAPRLSTSQAKSKDVPFLVEENEDLSCLTDPTREQPTIAVMQGQVCLFHHKRLRIGKGVPSMIYQQTVEKQKKFLEMWSSGSSDEAESDMELDMEDTYRRRSAFLVIEQYPETWAMWMGRRMPRQPEPPPPPPPKPNKRSTKGKKPPPPPKRNLKVQPSSSSSRPTATSNSIRTIMDHRTCPTGSNMAGTKRPMMYLQPPCIIDLKKDYEREYEDMMKRKRAEYMRERRRMRKARRIIRREKAERAIIDEMKRMSDLAFDYMRNGKPEDPIPEVVDLDLFIEFLKNRGRTPLIYRKLHSVAEVAQPHTENTPSESRSSAITKELSVNLCRLSLEQLLELSGKANTADSPSKYNDKIAAKAENQVTMNYKDSGVSLKSLSRPKNSNNSCDSDFNGNKLPAKGDDKMPSGRGKADDDSDLENSNLQNTDHESNHKASCDTNLLDKRVPRVLLENIAAKSLLANVPGLNDFHLMQPQNVEHIINVVQVSGVKTQMQSTSQTSTPVTAHIQRIGQPRPSEQKPENSTIVATSAPVSTNISNVATSSSTGHTTTKSQPSTLINILSQQVIRPANIVPSSSTVTGNSNGHTSSSNTSSSGNNSNSTSSSGNSSSTTTPTRRPPFINILSQQIIRPTQAPKGAPNNGAYTVTETVLPKPPITEPISSTVNNLTRPTITTTTIIPKTTSVVTTSQGISSGNISSSIPDNASNSPGTTVGNSQGSTIVQFICKSALPKFQQAFGKTVYQCTAETTESSTVSESSNAPTATICTIPVSTVTSNTDMKKNVTNVAKAVPVNVQSIQGNVIYSRQVPVGQTINLVPPTGATRQVFRIAASNPEQLNLVKDSVIHSKMSALLAAALQSRPKNTETEIQVQDDGTKITLTRPALVQNARIVKPVQLQLPTNVVRAPQPNVSSTTLEQLREFDMVYKQIKERSSNTTPTEISTGEQTQEVATPQRISVTYVNQLPKYTQLSPVVVVSSYSHLQQAATSPALSVTSQSSLSPCTTPTSTPSSAPKITTKTTKGKTFKNHTNNSTTKTSPISKPQQKPQEDEHTTQRIFDILAEYAEQLRNSPDLNNKPAPRRRSNPPTNPSQNSKRKKSSSSAKKTAPSNSNVDIDTDDITVGSEDSSGGGIVHLSVTDDEQSQSQAATSSIVESSEASTPTCPRQVILTDNSSVGSQARNVIIADSSVGEALKMSNTAVIVPGSYIMPVSMVKGGQQIAVMSGGSKILATVPARSGQNMLLFQSFTNQNRKGAISAVKYSSLQSVSGISSQSIAGVSAQPPVILPSNSVATAVTIGQQLALKKIGDEREGGEVLLTISQKDDTQPDSVTSVSSDSEDVKIPDQSNVKLDHPSDRIIHTYQKPISINKSHTVIATSISAQKVHHEPCAQPTVISTAKVSTTLNGPMLSHTTTNRFRKVTDSERTIIRGSEAKEDSTHNGAKVTNTEPKTYRSSAIYYTNKAKKVTIDSQKPESDAQKQAMLERELRLQKSLSEECEDLGVDEPSTSDLFPEADLLFDSNHSPSFDQNSQEGVKKGPHGTEKEEGTKSSINLFSDDDNSSSLKSDLFEYVEYHTVESALDHQAKQLMNGNNPETESSSCEDNTLLPKCSNMSEVTLNSPISPEVYAESSVNKYKFKYTNRKKSEKIKQSDSGGETITNSEDAVSSADSCKLSSEEENYKVVHVAITKSDVAKEESRCELHVCEEFVDSPSGRGARRSVRKLCSCCNGSQDGHHAARKRPNPSRPQTPATPHKKPFLKKR